jgi:cobalt-zinc-cadmium efflux system outer membrane protein
VRFKVVAPADLPVQTSPPSTFQGQPPESLPPGKPLSGMSLGQLEQIALASNPSLARAASLASAARGNWTQVGLMPNPSVGYEGQQLGSGGQAEQHGVLFTQEIVRKDKLRLNRAVAEQEVARAEMELVAQQQRVLTDVRIAFYRALLAQRQIDITAELLGIGRQGVQATENLFRAQEGNRVDVLQAQIELESAEILAENARNRHWAAWQSLAAVVGQPGLHPQPLVGDAYAPACTFDPHEVLPRLLTTSPEIAVVATDIERARYALARARVEPQPNINFQGLVNWQDNGIGGKPDAGIQVTVPVPLWNRNQGAILKAERELAAAQQALPQLELNLQDRLAPVFERYANARNQVERYRTRILPAAQQSLALTRQAYSVGEINYVSLLTVQRTLTQATLSYLDALRELRTAEAEIEGLLLTGSLRSQ